MYAPCRDGIHVCGISGDETEFVTVANVSGVSPDSFSDLATQFALRAGDDCDLVVDCMEGGDITRDFGIRRQHLDALLAACRAQNQ